MMHHISSLNHLLASLTIDGLLILLIVVVMYKSTITWLFFLVLSGGFLWFYEVHYVHLLKIVANSTSRGYVAIGSLGYAVESFFNIILISCNYRIWLLMIIILFSIRSISLSSQILHIVVLGIWVDSINTSISSFSLDSTSFFFCDDTRLSTSIDVGVKVLSTIWITLYALLEGHLSSVNLSLLHFGIDFWKADWVLNRRWRMVWGTILFVHIDIHWHSLYSWMILSQAWAHWSISMIITS